MCLTLYNFKSEKAAKAAFKHPSIAKHNILVYKGLCKILGKFSSPFRNFVYQRGFHYYQDGIPFTFDVENMGRKWKLNIHEGLHAYTIETNYDCYYPMVVPKGAKYFTDGIEIVADQLIFPLKRDLPSYKAKLLKVK